MAKNVLQKYWDGTKWEEIHPVTKATNVITTSGETVEKRLSDIADNSGTVKSVNGKVGTVVLGASDIKTSSGITVEDKLSSTTDLSADQVTVNNSNLNSKDVNSALTELFTFADNGKKNWVDVIGSPLLNTDSFSTLKSKTQTLKNTMASNLNSKAQSASGTEDLNSLINKIKDIEYVKIAEGMIPQVGSSTGEIKIEGLDFTPNFIVMWALIPDSYLGCGIYDSSKDMNRSVRSSAKGSGGLYDNVFYIKNNSVKLNDNWSIVNNNLYDVNWIALKK